MASRTGVVIWPAPGESLSLASREGFVARSERGDHVGGLLVVVVDPEPDDARRNLVVGGDHGQQRRVLEREVGHPLERAALVRCAAGGKPRDGAPAGLALLVDERRDGPPVDLTIVQEIGVVHDVHRQEVHAERATRPVGRGHELAAHHVLGLELELLGQLGRHAEARGIGEAFREGVELHGRHGTASARRLDSLRRSWTRSTSRSRSRCSSCSSRSSSWCCGCAAPSTRTASPTRSPTCRAASVSRCSSPSSRSSRSCRTPGSGDTRGSSRWTRPGCPAGSFSCWASTSATTRFTGRATAWASCGRCIRCTTRARSTTCRSRSGNRGSRASSRRSSTCRLRCSASRP